MDFCPEQIWQIFYDEALLDFLQDTLRHSINKFLSYLNITNLPILYTDFSALLKINLKKGSINIKKKFRIRLVASNLETVVTAVIAPGLHIFYRLPQHGPVRVLGINWRRGPASPVTAAFWVVVCHVIAVYVRHLLHRKITMKDRCNTSLTKIANIDLTTDCNPVSLIPDVIQRGGGD